MLKWVQSGLSAVAGTAEPEYGREAIHTITDTINNGEPVSRDTTIADFNWQKPSFTNVETQTFYFTDLKSGWVGFAQVIHSNVMGVHTTAQFTFRLFHAEDEGHPENIWTSTKLDNFRTEGSNFYADNLSFELNKDNNQYVLKSSVTPESVVELTVSRLAPGVIFGKDGFTLYGDDVKEPWGSMRHLFWPRCEVKGTVTTPAKTFDINGYTMFVMALQGMKPHHAAKSWNFLNFQSESYAAVQMEFTTPKSYGTTKVNIGIVASNEKILFTTINNVVVHKDSTVDEVGWPVPKSIEFNYIKDKKDEVPSPSDKVIATVSGDLKTLIERVDVMAEIPQFVKNIVSGVAGAKPYIYQYCNRFEIEFKEESKKESGLGFNEVTFISE
ncbi:survival factor 1 [Suhomyces tanzawaensis NRRL Y-17324]|uniref:Survival factor 1 n=1 Tax=Suhomyces tanzawaensis NRRL Y-17324 TaxID=984487 RepID=A0A1E4SDH4_9ASCO|nr:survival factor 1 [Suhomyces tanzawaensis NRRL Y-17324]ODV77571.1 survival factor 1 [Suhomyces tanzawaensis NRRL Y-17324]